MERGLSYQMLISYNACAPARDWFCREFYGGKISMDEYFKEISLTEIYKRCPDPSWLRWIESHCLELFPSKFEFQRIEKYIKEPKFQLGQKVWGHRKTKSPGIITNIFKGTPEPYYDVCWPNDSPTTLAKSYFTSECEVDLIADSENIQETKINIYPKFRVGDIVRSIFPPRYSGHISSVEVVDNGKIYYKIIWDVTEPTEPTREREEDLRLVGTYGWVVEYGKGKWTKEETVKNNKIVMEIIRIDKAVAVRILEMDERFRSQGEVKFQCKNGFMVYSHASLSIYPWGNNPKLFLRGNQRTLDKEWAIATFVSDEKREEFIVKMKEALGEWSQQWDGWEYKEEKLKKDHKVDSKSEIFSC